MEDYETKEEPYWPPMEMAAGVFGVNRPSDANHHVPTSKSSVNCLAKFTAVSNTNFESLSEGKICFEELGQDASDASSFEQLEKCCSLKKGKIELGFEDEYEETRDSGLAKGRGFGRGFGSPIGMQRKLSAIRTSMWKGRSFDSTGTDGTSSSQSSVSGNATGGATIYQQESYAPSNTAFDYTGETVAEVNVLGVCGSNAGTGDSRFGETVAEVNVSTGRGSNASTGNSRFGETVAEVNVLGVCGSNASTGHLSGDPRWSSDVCVERQAQAYRSAASAATAAAVWSGILPPRNTKGSAFSCKVFLGGVPWDITEGDLQMAFGMFGNPKIEWPASHDQSSRNVKGHLYLIFDTEKCVKQLLGSCNYDFNQGHHNWYYKVSSKRMRVKEVQVIPWQLVDGSFVRNGCMTTFGTKTVFVGSLHGMLTAEGLAKVLDDLFQGVVAATIDTDKYKYPIGSGRVTFNSDESYMKALRAVFVDLRTPKFNKKIQIDPFLEDSACSICTSQLGPYFCRDLQCFSYFCHACWQWQHSASNIGHHIPLMRNPRT